MNILVKSKVENASKQKRRMIAVLIPIWFWGLAITIFHHQIAGVSGAVLTSAVFIVSYLRGKKDPLVINCDASVLSVKRGETIIWIAKMEDLESIDVKMESEHFGVEFSPRIMVFREKNGKNYSVQTNVFERDSMEALVNYLKRTGVLFRNLPASY